MVSSINPTMKKLYFLSLCLPAILWGCRQSGGPAVIDSVDDLRNARIGTLMGSTHDAYVTEHFPDATVLRFDAEPDMFVAIDNNKADAAVLDAQTYRIGHEPSGKYKNLGTVYVEEMGVGFNYAQTDLRDQFNAFLASIKQDGTYDRIFDKWMNSSLDASTRMPEWDDVPKGAPLKVGFTGSTEGFGFIKDGKAAGFDVELLTLFGRSIGRPAEFLPINFGGLIAALASGQVNAIAAGITITPERAKQVAFSDPYFLSSAVAVTRASAPGQAVRLSTLDDAREARFAVVTGNLHDRYITGHFPRATPLRLDTYADVLMALEQGKADVACLEGIVYETSLKPKGIYRQIGVLFDDPYGMGFNKNNPQLRDRFNAFLEEQKQNGTLEKMSERWIGQYQTAKMPDLGPAPKGKPLRVGCSGATEVFDFMQDNHNSGFDIELSERFGRYLGRPVEFLTINFGGLIAALSSGKVDMIASAITINEERAKQIDFSEPYFVSQSIAVVMDRPEAAAPGAPVKGFQSMDDVKQKRIGALMGSIQDEYVTKTFTQAEILRIDMSSDLIMALKTNQCDAIVLPKPEAKLAVGKNDDLAILADDIFGKDNYNFGIGIGFRDAALRDRFNAWLSSIRADGSLDAMTSKWMDQTENAAMEVPATPASGPPLVIGTSGQSVPFTFLRDNDFVGLDIELVERFAAEMGRPVKFSVMNFGALIPSLVSRKIDVIANSVMITEERKKQVLFSDPYYNVGSTVLVRKSDLAQKAAPLHDGSDLATARVALMTGTTSEMLIEKEYPGATILSFDDINDAFLSVTSGKADYVFTSYTTALLAAKNLGNLVVLPEEYIRDSAAVAFNKRDTALLRQVNAALQKFKRDGTLKEIVDRWVRPDGSDYIPVEVPAATEGRPLRVGIAANREPMCFISNGKVAGLDAELIRRVAYELGRPVEFSDMKFTALIAAIEAGKVDLVISNYSVTPERLKRVNFSEGYFTNPQVLATLKADPAALQTARPNWFERVGESFYNNLVLEKRWMLILQGLWQTIVITLFSIILGTIVGGVICFLRMSRRRVASGFAQAYISVMRGTPLLVMLMIFFYVIFASTGLSATVVAVITFALNMGAYSSEMFRTSIQGVDRGQTEAGIALGFTKIQTFIHVIFPQALKSVLPVYKGEVISLLKMTSVVGYIAVVDLTKASDIIRSRTFDAFFPLILVAVIYFLLAWLMGFGLDKLNQKISSSK